MKTKPIIIAVLCIIVLIILLQNLAVVSFSILFWNVTMSRSLLILIIFIIGFAIGILTYPFITRKKKIQ
jgi:uncharacterized integral membrane protein